MVILDSTYPWWALCGACTNNQDQGWVLRNDPNVLPSFSDAILQYEPVITAGNEALVHHMEIFQCAAEFDSIPHYNDLCDSKMKPERLNYCRHVLAAWAMGAQVGASWDPSSLLGTFPAVSQLFQAHSHGNEHPCMGCPNPNWDLGSA